MNTTLYGAIGQNSFILYNINIAASITGQGRSSIASAILLYEGLLANNVLFSSFDEIVQFIYNITHENRMFNDRDILDKDVSLEDCFFKVMTTCGYTWIPSEEEANSLWNMMANMSQEDLNRIYYKNNIYDFFNDSEAAKNAIRIILKTLDKPFLDPNKPPECIKEQLDVLYDIIHEYVYYGHPYMDKLSRVKTMIRKISILTDTDSTMVCFDGFYNYIKDVVIAGEEISLKGSNETITEVIDDYDFINDTFGEREIIISSGDKNDDLRYSIINTLAYVCGLLSRDYMNMYSKSYNGFENDKCLLILKNEYLFKNILLNFVKKQYVCFQENQEGNRVPIDKALEVKGMDIDKSTLKDSTRKTLKKVLLNDILIPEKLDAKRILTSIVKLEKEIYKSLSSGKKDYYKPVTIRPISSYDDPLKIQGILASMVYNHLKDDKMTPININDRNRIDIVKLNINKNNLEEIMIKYPDKFVKINDLMNEITKFKEKKEIPYIAIPVDAEMPKWLLPYIDYHTIINDNIRVFPYESIGLQRLGVKETNTTNIISIF